MDVDVAGVVPSDVWARVRAQTGCEESVNKRDHSCAPEPRA